MITDELITQIIAREGGCQFTDRPSDLGGPTRWGITLATLAKWRNRITTSIDVQNLTELEARDIYYHMYVVDPGFTLINDERLRALLVDFGVNAGPHAAIEQLQAVVGMAVDGILGPNTLNAIERLGADEAYSRLAKQRARFLVRLALQDPEVKGFRKEYPNTALENLAGWVNRALEFL